ncbi:hypothetical protein [Sporomusa termitida]|nr:hypothetical protein [Sporomusa termitida]
MFPVCCPWHQGTEQWGKCIAGTRTIHAFAGKRIHGMKTQGPTGAG